MSTPTEPTGPTALEGWTFVLHDGCCAQRIAAAQNTSTGLRRLARKLPGGEPIADDCDLHCGLVAACKRRTEALERHELGQVHVIQHQVGMASRVEPARFEALIDENAVLARELFSRSEIALSGSPSALPRTMRARARSAAGCGLPRAND